MPEAADFRNKSPELYFPQESEMNAVLKETHYVLDRWSIAASVHGLMWFKPVGKALRPEELASLLTLLAKCCETDLPRAMIFDFNHMPIVGGQTTAIHQLLQEFSRRMGTDCRISSERGRGPGRVVLFQRPSAVADN